MGVRGKSGPKPGPKKNGKSSAKDKAKAPAKPKATAAAEAAPKDAGKKPAAAPPAPGSVPGHNLGGSDLTEREKRSLFLNTIAKIEELQKKLSSTNGDIRNERKRLKAIGFDTAEVNYALYLRKTDQKEAIDQSRRQRQVAIFLSHPIGMQPDLFDSTAEFVDRTPIVEKAKEEGRLAGMEGKPRTPPYQGEAEQAWLTGWHEGQEDLMKGFKALEKPAPLVDAAAAAGDKASDSFDDAMQDAQSDAAPEGEAEPEQEDDFGESSGGVRVSPFARANADKIQDTERYIKDQSAKLEADRAAKETAH